MKSATPGGLAGVHAGLADVLETWRTGMARTADLATLFDQFTATSS